MSYTLKDEEVPVQAASFVLRSPDGDPIKPAIPLYRIMSAKEVCGGLTDTEKECCNDIAADFLGPMTKYMNAKKALKVVATRRAKKATTETEEE